jgi:hypothetical protein
MTDKTDYSDFNDIRKRLDELSGRIMEMFDGQVEDLDPHERREIEDNTTVALIQALALGYQLREGEEINPGKYVNTGTQLRRYFEITAEEADAQKTLRELLDS